MPDRAKAGEEKIIRHWAISFSVACHFYAKFLFYKVHQTKIQKGLILFGKIWLYRLGELYQYTIKQCNSHLSNYYSDFFNP
jgi:hypothetical protein